MSTSDAPAPNYVDTDRPVRVGDRGAAVTAGGETGLVLSLEADSAPPDYRVTGWRAKIRRDSGQVVTADAGALHWVDAPAGVLVYLTDDQLAALRSSEPIKAKDRDALVDLLRQAVAEEVAGE